MIRSSLAIAILAVTVFLNFVEPVHAGMISFTTTGVAIQNVQLFTGTPFQVDATLTSVGDLNWNLDIDANGNTINSDSFVTAQFFGVLPAEFGVLGLAGAAFELSSLPTDQSVTTTNNGTVITVTSAFGISVPAAATSFYTATPSEFGSTILGVPFTSFHFVSPAVAGVYIGENPLGLDPGTLVGASFNRTVSSVPEPSSAALLALGAVGVLVTYSRRRSGAAASVKY